MDESIVREMNIEGLEVLEWIGGGNFSNVFKGIINDEKEVAIKVISEDDSVLNHELDILTKIKGCPHVSQIIDNLPSSKNYPIIILEYKTGISTKEFIKNVTLPHLKFVFKSLLESLNGIHKNSIVHQDVNLSNLIVSPDFKDVTLADWGCAHVVSDNLSPLVGSRLYRSPEMLIGAKNYRTAGDVWSAGVTILSVLTNEKIPWIASSADKELIEMSKIFGGQKLIDYAENVLKVQIKPAILSQFSNEATQNLEDFFNEKLAALQDPLLIDLLKKLLTLNMNERPTAEEALNHEFFK